MSPVPPQHNYREFGLFLQLMLSFYGQLIKGDEYEAHNLTVNEVSNKIVDFFGANEEHVRIKELKEKRDKINTYVINNDLFGALLTNVTKESILNETNFYQSLTENDHFRFLTTNDSDNLYLKLKAKMTRDDILKILALKSGDGKIMKSARRMMRKSIPKRNDEDRIHDVVDKFIAEVPRDDHKVTANESIYWDPQGALEDLKGYYDAKRNGRRVYKGERTNVRDWPFMVSIHIMGKFWCGGALYWNDLVITSASCLQLLHNNRFFRENPRVVQVRVGSNHSRVGGELIDVLEVYFHPGYDPKSLQNNLAVTRLRRHLAFTYHRIPKIVSIRDLPTAIPATAEVLILGWGVTKLAQKLSYEPIFLQKKYLPVYPNTFCKEVYGKNFITEKMFCAGTITTGEGACDHDAGGPAIFGGRLVGIISFGPAVCGFTNAPTVFTLIGAFSDWIETVNESMPNYYRAKRPTSSSTKSVVDGYFATWQASKWKDAEKKKAETRFEPLTLTTALHTSELPLSETFEVDTSVPTEPTDATENFDNPEVPESTTPETATTETSPTPPAALRMEDSEGGWSIENRK